MEQFKVIVAGSRDFSDYLLLCHKCDIFFSKKKPSHIISGNARGADILGKQYAEEHDIPCIVMPAEWDRYGKRAGYIRNQQMLDEADALIAFWDGRSRGTQHMIDIARDKGIPVRVVRTAEK